MLHTLQAILHSTAVTTFVSTTPGHDRPIAENGSKSAVIALNLLHIPQLILHSTTVTTAASMPPSDDRSVQKYSEKLGSAAHASAELEQSCCYHHDQTGPM